MSEYFDNEKLTELEKDIKTIPVDGEGRTLAVDYDEHFVRNNIIKLIADLRLSREEAAKQKFRFEYTEDLVKKAHADRDDLKTKFESLKAITELAVKGLELVANGNIYFPNWADTVDVLIGVRKVAKETISEIARLSQ